MEVVGSVIGGIFGKDAAEDAADAQVQSARESNQLQRDMFDQTRADQEPWRVGGANALYNLLTRTGSGGNAASENYNQYMRPFDMQKDYQEDPGYQFRLQQGTQALQRGAAAAGRLGSGRYLKDLTRFGQGEASQEFGNAWNRWNTQNNQNFNRLASIAGLGQVANNQIQQAGQNYANQAGQNIVGAGNARASGYIGGANAINNAISGGINAYQNNQMMNRLFPSGGRGYTVPIYENPEY